MELVEGDDLSQRIARGAIPLDEALPIAKQIAEALEAAHEQGIIHRDLKPANIKVRADGTVKVLDFGLAKAMDPRPRCRRRLSQSPTITTPAMTQAGVILGTAAYMAPEQARGKPVDKRSDIWAFGCVLFEMLTGRRAFEGDEVSDTLAAVLRAEPDQMRCPPRRPRAFVVFFGDVSRRIRSAGSRTFAMRASSWTNRLRAPRRDARGRAGDHRGESGSRGRSRWSASSWNRRRCTTLAARDAVSADGSIRDPATERYGIRSGCRHSGGCSGRPVRRLRGRRFRCAVATLVAVDRWA